MTTRSKPNSVKPPDTRMGAIKPNSVKPPDTKMGVVMPNSVKPPDGGKAAVK
jgi:hypothetical protein